MGSGLFSAQRPRAGVKDVPGGSAQEQRGHQEGRGACLTGHCSGTLRGVTGERIAGDYQSDERAGVAWLSWRVSGR